MQERPVNQLVGGDSKEKEPPASERSALVSELFRKNNRALINFLLTRLPDESEAKEVAQEAYVKLLQLEQPEAISFLRSYLFRIAANLAIDRIRTRGRREKLQRLELFEEWSSECTVERAVLAEQQVALIREAIDELKPKYQRALLLHRLKDCSVAEIAAEMQVTPRMVRTYIARAILYCRLRLDGYDLEVATRAMMELQP
jgi:RNA polymerase sigma factor (sigma-70 family)